MLYLNTKACIFAALVDNPANISPHAPNFLDTARSFHALTPEERNRVLPRIKLRRAVAWANYAGLAKQSPYNVNGEAELRLLNGQDGAVNRWQNHLSRLFNELL